MVLLRILDIVGSLLIIISVWNLQKSKWWWLLYIAGCLVFVVVFVITKCYAAVLLELILSGVSIRNFRNFGRINMQEAKVELVKGGRGASLLFPYAVKYAACKEFPAGEMILPARFTSDFASVPRVLWAMIPPQGEYTYAAMLHDFFYRYHKYPGTGNWNIDRKTADKLFYLSMRAYGVAKVKARLMYWAVRLFGVKAWKK